LSVKRHATPGPGPTKLFGGTNFDKLVCLNKETFFSLV
jgi:hypothetical protein